MILKSNKQTTEEYELRTKPKAKLSGSFLTEQKYIDLSGIVVPFSKLRAQNPSESEKELLIKRRAELNSILKRELLGF